jgi:RHS repeat-associated protein
MWQVPGTNQAWYAYDTGGGRTLQRSTVGSTTTETVYASGLEEYTYDSSSNLLSSTHYYQLAGHLLGELTGSGTPSTNFFLTTALGSVQAVISNPAGSATLRSTQLYAPYGSRLFQDQSMSAYTTKGFTGQYNDPTSGLDYYVSRYYDPVAGVFSPALPLTKKRLRPGPGDDQAGYAGCTARLFSRATRERSSRALTPLNGLKLLK